MNKLLTGLCVAAFGLSLAPVAPAMAAAPRPTSQGPSSVQHGFYNGHGYAYLNGHRGYRHYRPGYREYNGWWFPGAVVGGAIVGSIIGNGGYSGISHEQWCYDHYRSYRAYDNSYQPVYGPRRQCRGPF